MPPKMSADPRFDEEQTRLYWPPKRPRAIRDLFPRTVVPGNPVSLPSQDPFPSWYTYTIQPSESSLKLQMDLKIPAYGVMIMTPTEESRIHAHINQTDPEWDQLLNGSLEITLPPGVQRVRYKRVKVGLRSLASWRGDIDRKGEDDILFETEMSSGDENPEGNVIEGRLTFNFSISVPSTMPLLDRHKYCLVRNILYGIVEGLPPPNGASSKGVIEGVFPNALDAPTIEMMERNHGKFTYPPTPQNANAKAKPPMKLFRLGRRKSEHASTSPLATSPPPTGWPDRGDEWLYGERIAGRFLRVGRNPSPDGGINVLNEQFTGQVDGLGEYDIRCWSDVWTISSILKVTAVLVDVPPDTTIFCIRVSINQKHRVVVPPLKAQSEEDDRIITDSFRLPIVEEGEQPPLQYQFPDSSVPALWRGTQAGGTDKDILMVESVGRAYNDNNLHYTTPKDVKTPIRTSHDLEIDIFFSVQGQDAAGRPLRDPSTPGELRCMRAKRELEVPSCALLPSVLHLPNYGENEEVTLGQHGSVHRPWDACACYLTFAELEERMAQVVREEELARVEREVVAARKAEAEERAAAAARDR